MPQRTDPTTLVDTDAMRRFHEIVYAPHRWPDGAVLAVPSIIKGRGVRTDRIPVQDADAFVELCVRGVRSGADVYVNVAPQHPSTAKLDIGVRGGKKTALSLPALFVDVDTANGVHKVADKDGQLPLPSRDDAVALMRSLPLAVTVLVATGGGYHCWCCLDEPLDWASPDGADVLRRWKDALGQLFFAAGRHLDAGVVGDPARMLRVPGTISFKRSDEPRPVRLLDSWPEPAPSETASGAEEAA
jgi:hypothetical protein